MTQYFLTTESGTSEHLTPTECEQQYAHLRQHDGPEQGVILRCRPDYRAKETGYRYAVTTLCHLSANGPDGGYVKTVPGPRMLLTTYANVEPGAE